MPLKIRFHLDGDAPPDPYQHAKGLRAVVLKWIEEINPVFSSEIHDANQPKPYSISAIRRHGNERGTCWFELSLLLDELYIPILQGQGAKGNILHLGQQAYRVREAEIHQVRPFADIIRNAPATPREFRLRQQTPTAHHRGSEVRKAILLPDPELYWGNWWLRWNLCCEWQIPREVLLVVEGQAAVTYCQGGTQVAKIDAGRSFAGFVGEVTFGLLKAETIAPDIRKALAALAIFAQYSGTGVDTMRGMGETQLLDIL